MKDDFVKSDFFTECEFYPEAVTLRPESFEIKAIMEADFGAGEIGCEWVDNPDFADYWTIYARWKDGTVTAIADMKTATQANDLLALLQNMLSFEKAEN